MKLRDLIGQTQIRDAVQIAVMDGEYFETETGWIDNTGTWKKVFKTKRGTDFSHVLTVNEIDPEYLDYDVYCISGTTSKGLTVIDIKKPSDKNK